MTLASVILLLKKYWKVAIAVLLFVLISTLVIQMNQIKTLKEENKRKDKNIEEITKKNGSELTLTHGEYSKIDIPVKAKIDSVAKVAKISNKQIKTASVETVTYADTTKREAVHSTPQEVAPPKPMSVRHYKIPVKEELDCWGMTGYILTSDSNAKLTITGRFSSNSIQRLEVSKRFLGFLWITKKSEFRAFNDCGEVKIDKINFLKK